MTRPRNDTFLRALRREPTEYTGAEALEKPFVLS